MKTSQQQLVAKIKAACASKLKTSTLGGRSSVTFGRDKNGDYVKAGQSKYRITEELLQEVTRRHIELKKQRGINRLGHADHLSAGQYNKPNWENCPNNRACPFIAAALNA
ncbi:MAG: hypothetical protein HQ464_17240 [Planctomycetes bacterium]|nr:hypothetical protein [Planctomycetota bacterium]